MHPPLFIYGNILTHTRKKINPFIEFASYFDAELHAQDFFLKERDFSRLPTLRCAYIPPLSAIYFPSLLWYNTFKVPRAKTYSRLWESEYRVDGKGPEDMATKSYLQLHRR